MNILTNSQIAQMYMKLVTEHADAILLLQKTIRAVTERIQSKEEVAACDNQTVHVPSSAMMFSPMGDEDELTKERIVISMKLVNTCLSDDFGIHPSILAYLHNPDDQQIVNDVTKRLEQGTEEAREIDGVHVFGFYYCDGKEAYARVYYSLFKYTTFTLLKVGFEHEMMDLEK